MAKSRYVDCAGLVYYDGKIKKYVDDTLEEVIKVGKSVTFDELPDPSFQNINYIYKVTDSFTSNTRFEKQGLMYPAGTVVLVSNINDVYLYTIFYEPVNDSDVDLTTLLDGLERLESDVIDNTDRIVAVEKIEEENSTKLTELESSVAELNQTVSDLDNSFSDVEGTVQALQGQIDTIEQDYVTSKDLLDATTIQDLEGNKVDIVTEVKSVTEEIEVIKNEISILKEPLVYGEW